MMSRLSEFAALITPSPAAPAAARMSRSARLPSTGSMPSRRASRALWRARQAAIGMARRHEAQGHGAADIPGRSGQEDLHRLVPGCSCCQHSADQPSRAV